MKGASDLLGGCIAWSVILLGGRVGERLLFPQAQALRSLTLLEVAIVSMLTIVVLTISDMRSVRRFPVATRLCFVVALLCMVQWTWLLKVGPWFTADEERLQLAVRHPVVTLLIEGATPALLGACTWLLFIGPISMVRRGWLLALSLAGCLLAAWVVSPEVIRGTIESAGWVQLASPHHLSGAHTNPLARHVAYIAVAAMTGLLFYITTRQKAQSNSGGGEI
jgi:hypothetical protein